MRIQCQQWSANLLELAPFMQPMPELAVTSGEVGASSFKKLIYVDCRGKISYPEGKLCWNSAKRLCRLAVMPGASGLVCCI